MQYLDFEVAIDGGEDGEYDVVVLRSPAGEARGKARLPFDREQLAKQLGILRHAVGLGLQGRDVLPLGADVAGSGQEAVLELGRGLFDAFFAGQIGRVYEASLIEARRQPDRGLRMKLRTQAPELAVLPWELLYDEARGDFVCLSSTTPLIRYLELASPPEPLRVQPPLRILGMVASPASLARLDVAAEKARLEEAIADSHGNGLIELVWLPGQTWQALKEALGEGGGGPWHAFHFIGHGGFDARNGEGFLALASEDNGWYRLSAPNLNRLLSDHKTLRLVVLNACDGAVGDGADLFSSTAAVLVRGGLPAVVAMQYVINDNAAIEFAREFYRELALGIAVDTAVAEARKSLSLAFPDSGAWVTPVLHTRAPDGTLFDIELPEHVIPVVRGSGTKPELGGPKPYPNDAYHRVQGSIDHPRPGQMVRRGIQCSGVATGMDPSLSLWLAVEVDELVWLKENKVIVDADNKWSVTIFEDSSPGERPKRFAVALYVANSTVDEWIEEWLEAGRRTGRYRQLKGIPGARRIARVDELRQSR